MCDDDMPYDGFAFDEDEGAENEKGQGRIAKGLRKVSVLDCHGEKKQRVGEEFGTYGSFEFDTSTITTEAAVKLQTLRSDATAISQDTTKCFLENDGVPHTSVGKSFSVKDPVDLAKHVRELSQRFGFLEKSLAVRLENFEQRLQVLERSTSKSMASGGLGTSGYGRSIFGGSRSRRSVRRGGGDGTEEEEGSSGVVPKIRIRSLIRAKGKITKRDTSYLSAKLGDNFQVLRVHRQDEKIYVMNTSTWAKGFLPLDASLYTVPDKKDQR